MSFEKLPTKRLPRKITDDVGMSAERLTTFAPGLVAARFPDLPRESRRVRQFGLFWTCNKRDEPLPLAHDSAQSSFGGRLRPLRKPSGFVDTTSRLWNHPRIPIARRRCHESHSRRIWT